MERKSKVTPKVPAKIVVNIEEVKGDVKVKNKSKDKSK